MKRFLISLITCLLAVTSHAQYSSESVSFSESSLYYGMRLGIDFADFSGSGSHVYSPRTGMTLGGVIGMRFSEETPICIESGLYYTQRGGVRNVGEKKSQERTSLAYLEIPVLIKYGFMVSDKVTILPLVGPYFSLGIAGKVMNRDENMSESSYSDRYNRLDMGFKMGCGAEYNHLYVELGYQLGVANISKDEMNAIHGNAWFINIGVNLY